MDRMIKISGKIYKIGLSVLKRGTFTDEKVGFKLKLVKPVNIMFFNQFINQYHKFRLMTPNLFRNVCCKYLC